MSKKHHITSDTVILISQSCERGGMSSCIKEEGSTAKSKQCSKKAFGCKVIVASDIYKMCKRAHGEEMFHVPLNSSVHHGCDSSCPWIKPASRISKGWLDVCSIDACSFGNTVFFPIITNAHKETGTMKRLHNPHQLERRKPDTPIPSSALEAQKN